MPISAPEGHTRTLAMISGQVVRAKGLNNTKLMNKSQPFVIVKGIKGNSHLVDMFRTPIGHGSNPEWDAEWSYDCLKTRSRDEFVGLKYLVYDGDQFLGGADYDISEIAAYRTVKEELELSGLNLVRVKGKSLRKARIFVEISILRKFMPSWDPPKESLMKSMRTLTRVKSICGRIVRARGLHGAIGKKSLPMCYVRCLTAQGKVVDMHHSPLPEANNGNQPGQPWVDPYWDDIFEFDFEDETDQPLMLIFDIFGTAAGPRNPITIWQAGDHLGSAMLCVASIKDPEIPLGRHKLPLHNDAQLLEKRFGRNGKQMRPDPWALNKERNEGLVSKGAGAIIGKTKLKVEDKIEKPAEGDAANVSSKHSIESYHLTVDLMCEREEMPMKFVELLDESEIIERDDMEFVVNPDPFIMSFFDQGARRIKISGEQRITNIYGRICNAVDLIQTDQFGKSDPYVIVEALTTSGQLIFIYRSRVVTDDLNPRWDEAFYFKVPREDPENRDSVPVSLSKIQFSIYDSDEGLIGNEFDDEADDFLGRCSVDISHMRNYDQLFEDIPLLGTKTRPGGFKSQGGFRRYSTLSAEIRVERRIVRLVDMTTEIPPGLLDVTRHHESRPMYPPEVRGYRDASQEPMLSYKPEHVTAGKLLDIREKPGSLLRLARTRKQNGEHLAVEGVGWLKKRDWSLKTQQIPMRLSNVSSFGAEEDLESEGPDSAKNFRRVYISNLQDDWGETMKQSRADIRQLDYVSRIAPVPRKSSSLPSMSLYTRFGDRYHEKIADPYADLTKQTPEFQHFQETGHQSTLMNLLRKPPLESFSMRREHALSTTF